MNDFIVGIQCALEDYPIIGDDLERIFDGRRITRDDTYKECLYLLLDCYKQYKDGKISQGKVMWALGKLCELLDY